MRDSSFDDSAAHIKDQVQLGQYSELDSVASWIASLKQPDVDLEANESLDDLENVLFSVVRKIGSFLPIVKGTTKASLLEQLSYWRANKPLFEEAHERKPRLIDLTDQAELLAKDFNTQEDALNLLRRQKGLYNVLPHLEKSIMDRFDQEDEILIQSLLLQNESLHEVIKQLDLQRKPFDLITTHIDCKLPTFVAGAALVKKGMHVSVAFEYPQHPWLIIGKKRNNGPPLEMFVDYFPDEACYQSSPHIYRIEDDIKLYRILDLRSGAIQKGLIRNQDEWPIPFNAHTLELFDAWSNKSAEITS